MAGETLVEEHIVLVPGFFGFTHLGELPYFAHVEQVLTQAALRRQVPVGVSVVATDPTASLPYRAARVAEHLTRLLASGAERFHIVGHSSGGLDARLMVTPAVTLPTNVDVEEVARRVRSVVCVATPHRGTPLATIFAGRFGQGLLQVFSLCSIAIVRRGRVPVLALLRLAGLFERLRAGRRPNPSAVARVHDQLLADFSPERQAQLVSFLTQVKADQGLLPQLTPDGLELFNASTPDRPGVRYGSVVAWGRPPGVGTAFNAGLDPYAHATHALYTAIHNLSRAMPVRRAQVRAPGQDGLLGAAYGVVPGWDATDGIVPTRSQVWGELLHATIADHLDIVGYFSDPHGDPPHYDWLASASGFTRARFEALWADVAHFVLDKKALPEPSSSRQWPEPALKQMPADWPAAVPVPADWPIASGADDEENDALLGLGADDRVVPVEAHRRWVLGRAAVWAVAVPVAAGLQVLVGNWIVAIAVAVAFASVGEASYRRWVTVATAEGPARNLSTVPPRYMLKPSGRVVRLASAAPVSRLPGPDDPGSPVDPAAR